MEVEEWWRAPGLERPAGGGGGGGGGGRAWPPAHWPARDSGPPCDLAAAAAAPPGFEAEVRAVAKLLDKRHQHGFPHNQVGIGRAGLHLVTLLLEMRIEISFLFGILPQVSCAESDLCCCERSRDPDSREWVVSGFRSICTKVSACECS